MRALSGSVQAGSGAILRAMSMNTRSFKRGNSSYPDPFG